MGVPWLPTRFKNTLKASEDIWIFHCFGVGDSNWMCARQEINQQTATLLNTLGPFDKSWAQLGLVDLKTVCQFFARQNALSIKAKGSKSNPFGNNSVQLLHLQTRRTMHFHSRFEKSRVHNFCERFAVYIVIYLQCRYWASNSSFNSVPPATFSIMGVLKFTLGATTKSSFHSLRNVGSEVPVFLVSPMQHQVFTIRKNVEYRSSELWQDS